MVSSTKLHGEPAGSSVQGLCECGRMYRSATRDTGRTSRQNHQHRPKARSPRCVQTPIITNHSPSSSRRGFHQQQSSFAAFLVARRSSAIARHHVRAALISSSVRADKTGLPSHFTVICVPGSTSPTSTRMEAKRLHIGRRVHLVDQRPNDSPGGNCTSACCGVVQKVPAGAFVFISIGHVGSPFIRGHFGAIGQTGGVKT